MSVDALASASAAEHGPQHQIRQALCVYARRLVDQGLVVGPGGNISARCGEDFLVSPSGYDLDEVEPSQWVTVNLDSGQVRGPLRASSEVAMHLESYRRRADAAAVVHTHPPNCIALTTIEHHLPVLFPDQAALVDRVAYVDYMLPTTQAMGHTVGTQLATASAVLLANHGLVTIGRSLRQAYYRTQIMESAAMMYLLARAAGRPRALTDAEVAEIRDLGAEAYRIQLLEDRDSP